MYIFVTKKNEYDKEFKKRIAKRVTVIITFAEFTGITVSNF